MATINASAQYYAIGGGSNWDDWLSEVALGYTNSIVYLRFCFDKDISNCDTITININDDSSLQAGVSSLKVCISFFEFYSTDVSIYDNDNVDPSHSSLLHREYTYYNKYTSNTYTIPVSCINNTSAGTYYCLMIGTYGNSYSTSAGLKTYNTSISTVTATRTISYDANGGTGAPSSSTVDKGSTVSLSSTSPSKQGNTTTTEFTITGKANGGNADVSITATKTEGLSYVFLGWSTSSTATSATYSAGQSITVSDNIKLYAVWGENNSVTYANNTLKGLTEPTRNPIGSAFTVTLEPNGGSSITSMSTGIRTEYYFSGWGETALATTTIDPYTEYTSSKTVYAVWTSYTEDNSSIQLPIPIKNPVVSSSGGYTVTLDPNGGTINDANTTITANKTTEYIFDCWSIDNTKNGAVDMYYTPTSDVTLYAIWDTSTSIESVGLPVALKSGYLFSGWTATKDSGENVANPYKPTSNITLYANWVLNTRMKMFLYHNNKWYHITM